MHDTQEDATIEHLPSKQKLWNRAVLYGIINAILTSQNRDFAAMRYWYRNHYILNGLDGREGVVTFAGGHWYSEGPLIGVFHDVHSERFSPEQEINRELFFRGCTTYQRSLADQYALRHLKYPYEGKTLHRVTSVFWDRGKHLLGADTWTNMMLNGVNLIDDELSDRDYDEVFASLCEDFSPDIVRLAQLLFDQKIARPPSIIEVGEAELQLLKSHTKERDNNKAIQECIQMLAELGIIVV